MPNIFQIMDKITTKEWIEHFSGIYNYYISMYFSFLPGEKLKCLNRKFPDKSYCLSLKRYLPVTAINITP